ncbi:MAG: hypothetical protein V7636_930 [Actinomycetota bacterium]|jgi:hypothetical protein
MCTGGTVVRGLPDGAVVSRARIGTVLDVARYAQNRLRARRPWSSAQHFDGDLDLGWQLDALQRLGQHLVIFLTAVSSTRWS